MASLTRDSLDWFGLVTASSEEILIVKWPGDKLYSASV
jgi:hypothetical protein